MTEERKPPAPLEDDETPAIYSIDRTDGEPTLTRRTFLDIAAMAAGTVALMSGCATPVARPRPAAPPPRPSPTPEPVRANPNIGNAHKSGITALAVNTAGTLLASGDQEGTIKLWQLPEGVLLQSWSGHASAVGELSFPHASDALWSVAANGGLKRWHLPDGKEISDGRSFPGVLMPLGDAGLAFAAPAAADWYAARASGAVEIRSQSTGEKLRSLEAPKDGVTELAATSSGRLLVAGGGSGTLGLWTEPAVAPPRPPVARRGGRKLATPTVPAGAPTAKSTAAGRVNAIGVAPDGTRAVSAHGSGSLQVWSLPDLGSLRQYESSFGAPHSIAIRPQDDLFVVGSEKPAIGLWKLDVQDASPQTLTGHSGPVRAVAITPDGSLLISGSDDKTIRLWSLPDGKHLRVLVDLASSTKKVEGVTYQGTDIYGRSILFTLPCGSPIPPGAVCVCNCVPGTLALPNNFSQSYNTQGFCTCDTICTCNTICTCQSVGGRYVTYWYPN